MSDTKAPAKKQSIGNASVEGEIERLCGDDHFKVSQRHKRLLRYLGIQSADGKAPKAYSIGLDVFDRPDAFDPNIDPIVRVEVSRLRVAIQAYYKQHPRSQYLKIPAGSYAITLADEACEHASADKETVVADVPPHPTIQPQTLSRSALVLLMVGFMTTITLQIVQIALMLRE